MYNNLEIFIKNKWKSFNSLYLQEIQTIEIKNLEIFKDEFLYKIYQILNYYKLDYNNTLFRQCIEIESYGIRDFEIKHNTIKNGSINTCFLCNSKFKALRNNIHICNANHYCYVIDFKTGNKYKKLIQKWNKIEKEDNKYYIYGKFFENKSNQVSSNNYYTLFKNINIVKNKTKEERQETALKQIEQGTLWVACASFEERSIVNKKIFDKRIQNGTFVKEFQPNFIEKNNQKFYFDYSTNSYILWSDFKKKFNRKQNTKDIEYFINKIKNLDIFKLKHMGHVDSYNLDEIIQIIPTFRKGDSINWSGSRVAFEKYLVEKEINWFCYIKFYKDLEKNSIRPLVVGKTGSLNVNSSGTDVSFSEDLKDGPARVYLSESNGKFVWYKEKILIIKSKSEKQALYYEYYISKFFNLFQS